MKPEAPLVLPGAWVDIAGRRLNEAETSAIASIRIQRRPSLPAQCEITFQDLSSDSSPLSSVVAGLSLQVHQAGAQSEPLFQGEVTVVEFGYDPAQGRTLRVRGYDRLHRLRKRQSARTHVQVGLADLARELVRDLGVRVEAPPSDVLWGHVIQHGATDLDFLAQRAEACGCYFLLQGDVLRFFTLEGDGSPVVLRLGESLLEARFEVNGESACGEVRSLGWDPLRIETHAATAASARVGREVAARVPPDWIGAGVSRLIFGAALQTDRQAEALAQGELDRRAAREVVLWGVAEGDPRLGPGAVIEVAGVARELCGRFVLTQATHLFDHEHGFVTEIDSAPPPPASRPRGLGLLLGRVTRVNDPESLGRVKVSLPACEDQETDWMQVVTVGAGAGKGMIALPDVGDTVLVLCLGEDPAQGIVLGGVYGAAGAPDSGVEGEAVRRFTVVTSGGQRLCFDDEHKSVRVENTGGSYVELRPDQVALHAAADLRIEAPGRRIVIRGHAIDFEEA